jgi:hypothetical protein
LIAFGALPVDLLVQSTVALVTGHHPHHSTLGIVWTAVTAVVMFVLAAGKTRTCRALGNPVLKTEGRVTLPCGRSAKSSTAITEFPRNASTWPVTRHRSCRGHAAGAAIHTFLHYL